MSFERSPVLHHHTSMEGFGAPADDPFYVNAAGVLENLGAGAAVPLQNDEYDVEAQDPSPTRSLTSSEICLPGSLHQLDGVVCTSERIILLACCAAFLVVGLMFVYWSYEDG